MPTHLDEGMERRLVAFEVLAVLAEAAQLLLAPNIPEKRVRRGGEPCLSRPECRGDSGALPRPKLFEGCEADRDVREARLEERVERGHLGVDIERLRGLVQAHAQTASHLIAHRRASCALRVEELLHLWTRRLRLLIVARLAPLGLQRGRGVPQARAPHGEWGLAPRLLALVDVLVLACELDARDLEGECARIGFVTADEIGRGRWCQW